MSGSPGSARVRRGPTGHRVGESHGRAKYPDWLVEAIRLRYLAYVRGYTTVGREFGVPASTVRDIVQYRTRVSAR